MTSSNATCTFPRKILLLFIGLLVAVAFVALAPSTAHAIGYYDVWVGDVHVDGLNCDDVLAESHNGSKGKVRLVTAADDPKHLKLYLDSANIKVADIKNNDAAGIYIGSEVKCLDIILTGKNTISMPSGALSSDYINGICGNGGILNDSSICIYSNASGASLSMTLSSDDSWVYGIYNSNHGVEIESTNLSMTLSSGEKAYGIAAYGTDSEDGIDISKSTVRMSIFGATLIEGMYAQGGAGIIKSTVWLDLGQGKTCSGQVFGVYASGNRIDVLGNSNVVINGGASSDSSFGIFGADVWSASDSILHVYAGDAPDSVGMTGNGVLYVEEGSVADFSGYTQAIQNLVNIPSIPTQDLGAFVNTSPTFSGGSVWNGSTPLSSYKYVHFPYNISITEVIVDAIANQNYTGKALTPAFTVRLGNTILSKSTDYAFSYSNNIKPGTAKITITGKGLFAGDGVKTATFTIVHKVTWKRVWGATAPITMQKIAAEFGKTSSAVVTTDASYKDALAASALAGKCNGLVLMTNKSSLTAQTKAALKSAGVKNVYIVGSTANVSAAVEKQLKSGTGVTKVVRIAGTTPSQRAVAAAKYGGKKSDTVIIATQNSFQDALSIAPYSYATKSPILYAETNKSLSAATVNYIKGAKFKKAIVIGGPLALPASIDTQLKKAGVTSITRLAGANAYRTSELIASWTMGKLANGNHDKYKGKAITYVKFQPSVKMKANKLAVSTGQNWLDALAGAALCGKNKSVMLLADTKGGTHYSNAVRFCKTNKLNMTTAYIFGGTSAVSAATATALNNATK